MKHTYYLLILIVFISGCKKNPVIEETPQQSTTKMNITNIIPTVAIAGDIIKIFGVNFDSTYWHNFIYLNSVQLHVDSGNFELLYTRVPFKASSGNLSIIKYRYDGYTGIPIDSVTGPQIAVTPIDTTKFNLVHYYGPQLTEAQSQMVDDIGIIHKWSGSKNGDTVFITKTYPLGDEGTITESFWFYQSSTDSFPSSARGYIGTKILESYSDAKGIGIIAIQEWDIKDKIVGRISVFDDPSGMWQDYVFWLSFK